MIIAVYNLKGGVGKTTLAVNLAWASATRSGANTLLWDLDAQGASSFILNHDPAGKAAASTIRRDSDPLKLVLMSEVPGLSLLPADRSLRDLDRLFFEIGKRKRLAKIADELAGKFDHVIIDCPPGLTETSEQILRAADLVVVPIVPAALSRRALDEIKQHLAGAKGPKPVLAPVFSMVDRRRALHRAETDKHAGWPVIPMASAYERMSEERKPIGAFLSASAAPVRAVEELWKRILSSPQGRA